MGYPAYQCFKTQNREVYCSNDKVKNHATGAKWIERAITHFQLQANEILGKPYTSERIPRGAHTCD